MPLLGEEYLEAEAFRVARGQDGLACLVELVEVREVPQIEKWNQL